MRYHFLLLFLSLFIAVGCVSENSEDTSEPVKEPFDLKRQSNQAPSSYDENLNDEEAADSEETSETPARPLNFQALVSQMKYPKEASEKGVEGQVIVRVFVDDAGGYVKHEIVKSPDPLLTKAAEPIVRQLKFAPATKNGAPVSAWVTLPITFQES